MKKSKEGLLSAREKLSFGLAMCCSNPLLGLLSGYLLLFYTTIVKLDPIAVGTLFLLSRLVDGISDPIMGFVIDKLPHTKMGKYRTLLIVGSLICCANFALIWVGPLWAPSGKLAIAYITYLLFGFTFDLMDVPKNSLLPTVSSNEKDIMSLGKASSFATILSGLVVSIGAPIILGENDSSSAAYMTVVWGTIAFTLLTAILGAVGVKQRVRPVDESEKHSVKEYLMLFTHKPVLAVFVYAIFFAGSTYVSSGVTSIYFTYVIGDLTQAAAVSILQLVGLIPGVLLAGWLVKKFTAKGIFIWTPIFMIVGTMIRLIDIYSVPLIAISTLLLGFGLGAYQPAASLIGVYNVDYVEQKTGYRSESAISSMNTFIAKVAGGIGGSLPAYVLGWCGFVEDAAVQPEGVITGLVMLATVIPSVLLAISAVVFQFMYNLKQEDIDRVRSELETQRAADGIR